jgi:hypothetical protein
MDLMKRVLMAAAGVALAMGSAACGGAEPEAKYPDPPQPIGETTRGPVVDQSAQGANGVQVQAGQAGQAGMDQQASVQNAAAGGGDIQAQSGDVQIGADDAGYAETDPGALEDFREPLNGYGTWTEDASYGTVWVPSREVVGADFAPYVSAGHWAYDDEYVWESDYSWGWAPFHYGRWVWIGGTGWAWIPGRVYSGGWVVWRTGGYGYGYVGWAPAPPGWYWYGGYPVAVTYVHPVPYTFCHTGDVFHPQVAQHVVTGPQVAQIGAATRPYTPATPSVNGSTGTRTTAHPNVGPNPSHELGIAHPPGTEGNAGIAHARAFANPQTAASVGGHAPRATPMRNTAGSPSSNPSLTSNNLPAHESLPPRLRPTATSPQYAGVSPTPHPQSYTLGSRTDPGSSQRAPSSGQSMSSYSSSNTGRTSTTPYYSHSQVHSTPTYSAPSHPSTPAYSHSSPSFSQSYTAPTHSYSSGSSSSYSSHPTTSSHVSSGGRGGHR